MQIWSNKTTNFLNQVYIKFPFSVVPVSSAIIISVFRTSRFRTLPSLAMASICCCKTCSHRVKHQYYIEFLGFTTYIIANKWLIIKYNKRANEDFKQHTSDLRLVPTYLLQVSQTLFMNFGWARKINGASKSIAISLDARHAE